MTYVVYRSVQSYPLDAFEEHQVHKATQWLRGASLYGPPESEAVPEAYPPLYFWLLGLWVQRLGESFVTQRSLSLIALGGMIACGCWGLRNVRDRRVAWLSFCAFLFASHALAAKFFEVGKPDSLFAMCLALAIVSGEHRTWCEAIVSSVALWLASLTKQNAPLFLVPLCISHALRGRRLWALGWGSAMSLMIVGSYAVLDWLWGERFLYWVFRWMAGHGIDAWDGARATCRALTTRAPWLWLVLLASALARPRCRWTGCLLAAVAVAAIGMSKAGGRENHLLPVAWLGAFMVADWFGRLWPESTGQAPERRWRWGAAISVILVLASVAPSTRDFRWVRKRADEARAWTDGVRQLDGTVAVSHHYLLARRAGAECFFSDLILEFPGLQVASVVRERISRQEFDYLLLEADPSKSPTPGWSDLIDEGYVARGNLKFPNRSDLLPKRLYMARRLVR